MYLVRRTRMGMKSVFPMLPSTPSRVWEWNGTSRFTDGSKTKIFGEGWSAIASTVAKADLMIEEYAHNLRGWESYAVHKKS